MEQPRPQDLKYGIIYVYYDPEVKDAFGRNESTDLISKIAHPFKMEWVPVEGRGRDNTLLVARRFNVGNIGRCATVSLRTSDNNPRGVQFDALHKFRDLLFQIEDGNDGDILLDEDGFGYPYNVCEDMMPELEMPMASPTLKHEARQDKTRVSLHRRLWRKKKELFDLLIVDDDDEEIVSSCERVPEEDLIEKAEVRELADIERERRHALEQIRRQIISYIAQFHQDPTELMEELLKGKVIVGQPGRVLVNGDLKIVLPEYDEMEIKMPAMSRSLYILFMKLRKQGDGGIVLRDIDQYRDEIIGIYSLVKPGADDQRVAQSVDNLCDPYGESLHQAISRINRCIRSVITDKKLAEQYIIKGTRGHKYSIALEPEYMELPRAIIA